MSPGISQSNAPDADKLGRNGRLRASFVTRVRKPASGRRRYPSGWFATGQRPLSPKQLTTISGGCAETGTEGLGVGHGHRSRRVAGRDGPIT